MTPQHEVWHEHAEDIEMVNQSFQAYSEERAAILAKEQSNGTDGASDITV